MLRSLIVTDNSSKSVGKTIIHRLILVSEITLQQLQTRDKIIV